VSSQDELAGLFEGDCASPKGVKGLAHGQALRAVTMHRVGVRAHDPLITQSPLPIIVLPLIVTAPSSTPHHIHYTRPNSTGAAHRCEFAGGSAS